MAKKKINNKIVNAFIIAGILLLIASLILMFVRNKEIENHIIEINYEKYNEIVNTDDYRIILLTSPTCLHCKNYKKSVNYVCDENNISVYNLNINDLDYDKYIEIHDMYNATKELYNDNGVPTILTPTTVVTKNGDEVYSISGDIGYNGFLNLLKSYLK